MESGSAKTGRSQRVFVAGWIRASVAGAVILAAAFASAVFLVASYRFPAQTVCATNLARIHGGKSIWALDNHRKDSDEPRWEDLIGDHEGYLRAVPLCPCGGTYALRQVSAFPACSFDDGYFPHGFTFPFRTAAATNPSFVTMNRLGLVVLIVLPLGGITTHFQISPSVFFLFGRPLWLRDEALRQELGVLPHPHRALLGYMNQQDQRWPARAARRMLPLLAFAVLIGSVYFVLAFRIANAIRWWIAFLLLIDLVLLDDLFHRKASGLFRVYRLAHLALLLHPNQDRPSVLRRRFRVLGGWLLLNGGVLLIPPILVTNAGNMIKYLPLNVDFRAKAGISLPSPSPAVVVLAITVLPVLLWIIPKAFFQKIITAMGSRLAEYVDREFLQWVHYEADSSHPRRASLGQR